MSIYLKTKVNMISYIFKNEIEKILYTIVKNNENFKITIQLFYSSIKFNLLKCYGMDIKAISPIEGRYFSKTKGLENYFSEYALINSRIKVEIEYFIFLTDYLYKHKKIKKNLSKNDINLIRRIYKTPDENARIVKEIETKGFQEIKPTNHDVKAIEYYIKKKLDNKINTNLELIHFGLTSEDVNNISYSLMINNFIKNCYLKKIDEILLQLYVFLTKYSKIPFPARTHGQIASPTTFGKEIRVFYERIKKKAECIKNHKISVKLNGAVGNYNAVYAAYPDINWIDFSKKFVEFINRNLKTSFEINLYTTQIEPHDSWVELFSHVKHLNTILIGFCQDIWRYISDDLIILKKLDWEVGSSTMPHKVNPIDFENAEGNFQLANSLFSIFIDKFPISRLQRDLSDSTVERNIGVAFAHTIIAFLSLLRGLSKIDLNIHKSKELAISHPEVYSEAIQTILRKHGIKNAYEMLKDFSRGKLLTNIDITKFIKNLNIDKKIKHELLSVVKKPYIGIADKLAIYKLNKSEE